MGINRREKYVYKVPMANGRPTILFRQEPSEVFSLRADGTYITDRINPALEQAGIKATPWVEQTMRAIPAPVNQDDNKPAKTDNSSKSSKKSSSNKGDKKSSGRKKK